MEIKVKVNKLENTSNGVLGLGTLSFGDKLKIRGVRVMDGRNGLFVGLPAYRRKDENGKDTYSDIVRLTEDDFKKAFQKAALDAFATGEEFTIKTVEGKDDPDINVGVSLLSNGGKTKALARLHIENVVDVNSVAIREGRDGGLFVSMPSYQTSKTDDVGNPVYQNYCYAATKEFAETLSKAVLNKYETVQNELLDTPEKPTEKPSLDSQLTEAKKKQDLDKSTKSKPAKTKSQELG